jgi:hypothetical protein
MLMVPHIWLPFADAGIAHSQFLFQVEPGFSPAPNHHNGCGSVAILGGAALQRCAHAITTLRLSR